MKKNSIRIKDWPSTCFILKVDQVMFCHLTIKSIYNTIFQNTRAERILLFLIEICAVYYLCMAIVS